MLLIIAKYSFFGQLVHTKVKIGLVCVNSMIDPPFSIE